MQFTELNVRMSDVDQFGEILIAKLNDIEFESYSQDEFGVKAYVQTSLFDKNAVLNIIDELSLLSKLSFTLQECPQENWNAVWESNFQPVKVNNRCIIRAHFHKTCDNFEYEIIINPKMSFGTGHHETTLLVMNQMFNLDFKDKSVLDVGSGTGVLSILASKLGANYLIGIDFDEWAYKNAIENAFNNGVSNIDFIHGNAQMIGDDKFDIIMANINRNIILEDLALYVQSMQIKSEIILSGFLEKDIPLILKKSKQLGLDKVVSKNKNEWYMLHLKKV